MDFVFELPPRREPRHRIGHADQEASVPFQGARPDIEHLAEQLWADAVVLIVPVRELSDFARLAVILEAGLDHEAIAELQLPRVYARLPRPEELRPCCSIVSDVFFEEEVDRVAQTPEILAQDRTGGDLVRIALLR